MNFCSDKYTVFASVEMMPPLAQFDVVHNTENIDTSDFYMAQVFRIQPKDRDAYSVAVVDLICAGYEPFAVLEGDFLTVILFSAIFRMYLSDGKIVQYVKCDNMGGLFEIHPIPDGYIIWDEGDIFRYDLDLNRVWHFTGRDILVSLMRDKHFWIEGNLIHVRDFEGWHYILDLDGILLDNFREDHTNE